MVTQFNAFLGDTHKMKYCAVPFKLLNDFLSPIVKVKFLSNIYRAGECREQYVVAPGLFHEFFFLQWLDGFCSPAETKSLVLSSHIRDCASSKQTRTVRQVVYLSASFQGFALNSHVFNDFTIDSSRGATSHLLPSI